MGPFHKLTARERDVAARILAQYFVFKGSTDDQDILYDLIWSKKSRKDMMTSLGMTQAHFQITLGKLRASGFLEEEDHIKPQYIPHKTNDPRLGLMIVYDWSSPTNPIHNEAKQD